MIVRDGSPLEPHNPIERALFLIRGHVTIRAGLDHQVIDNDATDVTLELVKESAGIAHDLFVNELVRRIGPTYDARLKGNHAWGESYLHVFTNAGHQTWHIVHVTNTNWRARKVSP